MNNTLHEAGLTFNALSVEKPPPIFPPAVFKEFSETENGMQPVVESYMVKKYTELQTDDSSAATSIDSLTLLAQEELARRSGSKTAEEHRKKAQQIAHKTYLASIEDLQHTDLFPRELVQPKKKAAKGGAGGGKGGLDSKAVLAKLDKLKETAGEDGEEGEEGEEEGEGEGWEEEEEEDEESEEDYNDYAEGHGGDDGDDDDGEGGGGGGDYE